METQKTSVLQEGGHPEIRRTQNEDNHIRKIFNFFFQKLNPSPACLTTELILFVLIGRLDILCKPHLGVIAES